MKTLGARKIAVMGMCAALMGVAGMASADTYRRCDDRGPVVRVCVDRGHDRACDRHDRRDDFRDHRF